jgi:hypothetical protein
VIRTAADEVEAQYKDAGMMPPAVKAQAEHWRRTAQRYETEPETNEGRKELSARAKAHEAGTVRNLVCEAMMMGSKGASYGYRERPVGPASCWSRSEGRFQ